MERVLRATRYDVGQQRVVFALLLTFFTCLVLYVYFLYCSVHLVIERKAAEAESVRLSAEVSELESEYAVVDKKINLAFAHAKGFTEVARPIYMTVPSTRETFTMREN